jgi:hypothetical protein
MYFSGNFIPKSSNMTTPNLTAGRVYRTAELTKWDQNPARLAKRLVKQGKLYEIRRGLFVRPEQSKFGATPPTDQAVMRGFLKGSSFVFTGPEKWNALGLGTTALFATPLVYNTKRSGSFKLGGRLYTLRRVKFPPKPSAEWYAVDLLENHSKMSVSTNQLREGLTKALRDGRLDRKRLESEAMAYGTDDTLTLVKAALQASTN